MKGVQQKLLEGDGKKGVHDHFYRWILKVWRQLVFLVSSAQVNVPVTSPLPVRTEQDRPFFPQCCAGSAPDCSKHPPGSPVKLGRETRVKKLLDRGEDGEIAHQLPLRGNHTQLEAS